MRNTRWLLCVLVLLVLAGLGYVGNRFHTAAQTGVTTCSQPRFRSLLNFPTYTYEPHNLVSADFNGDDWPDVAVLAGNQSNVLLGDGGGGWQVQRVVTLPLLLTQAVPADFNADGILDLAGISFRDSRNNVALLLGDGSGQFSLASVFSSQTPRTAVVGDFNNDGHLDLVSCSYRANTIELYPGNGKGQLGQPLITSTEQSPSYLAAGDFNGDSLPDVAVSYDNVNSVAILANNGSGRFTPLSSFASVGPYELEVADFNLDQKPDLVVQEFSTSRPARQAAVYLNSGAGQFTPLTTFPGTAYTRVYARDWNRDNAPDLLLIKDGEIDFLLNNGRSGFARTTLTGLPTFIPCLLADDLNLDGRLDLVFGNTSDSGGKIYVGLAETGGGLATVSHGYMRSLTDAGIESASGDFNQDGNADVLVLRTPTSGPPGTQRASVAFLLGNGAGQLTEFAEDLVGVGGSRLLVRDFNRDGLEDWAVSVANENKVVVALGDGRGTFSVMGRYDTARVPIGLAAADFNGDGKLDLATTGELDNVVTLLFGNGTGQFSAGPNFPAGNRPVHLAAGDFNQDGRPDLAVTSRTENTITILLGNQAGGFDLGSSINPEWKVTSLAVADTNRDGKLDLLTTHRHPNAFLGALAIWQGDGAGKFMAAGWYELDGEPRNLTLADLNRDGALDLAISHSFLVGVATFINDGQGKFVNKTTYYPYGGADALAVNDFNRDSQPDLFAMTGASRFTVALGDCLPQPLLATVSAASYRATSLASESVTALFGDNLAVSQASATAIPLPTTLGEVSVSLRDSSGTERLAPLFFVSPTQINFQMPPGLAVGPAVLTVNSRNTLPRTSNLKITKVSPGLFSADASGQGLAAALALRVRADGSQRYEPIALLDPVPGRFTAIPLEVSNPAEQVFLILYGTGIRQRSSLGKMTARIGGELAEISFAGAQGQLVGVDQINLRVPRSLSGKGDVEIFLTADGKTSNAVKVVIK